MNCFNNLKSSWRQRIYYEVLCSEVVAWKCSVKIETLAQVFTCEFYDFFKNTFFVQHLRGLLLFIASSKDHLQQNSALSLHVFLSSTIICSRYLKYRSFRIWVGPLTKSIKIGKPRRRIFLVIIFPKILYFASKALSIKHHTHK